MVRALILAFAILVAGIAPTAQASIQNGSFEEGFPDDPNVPPYDQQVFVGVPDIPGWTVFDHEIAWILNIPGVASASDGTHFLDLTGFTNSIMGGVSQLAGTAAGHQYQLTFDHGTYRNQSATITAAVGGIDVLTVTTTAPGSDYFWETSSLLFTATSDSTLIAIRGISTSPGGDSIGLDNVTLTDLSQGAALPEPAGLTIWGLGTLACMLLSRRRLE